MGINNTFSTPTLTAILDRLESLALAVKECDDELTEIQDDLVELESYLTEVESVTTIEVWSDTAYSNDAKRKAALNLILKDNAVYSERLNRKNQLKKRQMAVQADRNYKSRVFSASLAAVQLAAGTGQAGL